MQSSPGAACVPTKCLGIQWMGVCDGDIHTHIISAWTLLQLPICSPHLLALPLVHPTLHAHPTPTPAARGIFLNRKT